MARRFIRDVDGVPSSPSPISHAVVVGNTCHISGQLSVYEDGYRRASARDEAARAFELVFRIAAAAGFTSADIVYVDIAFADLDDVADVNTLYDQLFSPPPARTIYQAARLPFDARVKVQAIAMRDD